jgi:hypothetical protein
VPFVDLGENKRLMSGKGNFFFLKFLRNDNKKKGHHFNECDDDDEDDPLSGYLNRIF